MIFERIITMKFNIGDKIKVTATGEGGVITDRMYSEARSTAMYIVKPEDGGRSIMRREDELEHPPHREGVEHRDRGSGKRGHRRDL